MLLGPQCNHDLAVLLRLCDLPEDAPDAKLDEDHVAVVKAAMVEAMGDHEVSSNIIPALFCDASGPFRNRPRSVLRCLRALPKILLAVF